MAPIAQRAAEARDHPRQNIAVIVAGDRARGAPPIPFHRKPAPKAKGKRADRSAAPRSSRRRYYFRLVSAVRSAESLTMPACAAPVANPRRTD